VKQKMIAKNLNATKIITIILFLNTPVFSQAGSQPKTITGGAFNITKNQEKGINQKVAAGKISKAAGANLHNGNKGITKKKRTVIDQKKGTPNKQEQKTISPQKNLHR
jgi:hypothetical protein